MNHTKNIHQPKKSHTHTHTYNWSGVGSMTLNQLRFQMPWTSLPPFPFRSNFRATTTTQFHESATASELNLLLDCKRLPTREGEIGRSLAQKRRWNIKIKLGENHCQWFVKELPEKVKEDKRNKSSSQFGYMIKW